MTQYDLERRYAAWRSAGADPTRAGTVADWVLELDGDRLVLNPIAQRWFIFDTAHDDWRDSEIVPGEAIFVSLGGVVGAKRALAAGEITLPLEERIERVGGRVIAALDGELYGPMEASEADGLAPPGSTLHMWSTRQPQWLERKGAPPSD